MIRNEGVRSDCNYDDGVGFSFLFWVVILFIFFIIFLLMKRWRCGMICLHCCRVGSWLATCTCTYKREQKACLGNEELGMVILMHMLIARAHDA